MKNVTILNHPLLGHTMARLRDRNTAGPEFRRLIFETARLMAYEATRDLKTTTARVETPKGTAVVTIPDEKPIVVAIMRAGIALLEGMLSTLPFASAGHIGIYRDKFINTTVEYYFRMPKVTEGRPVILTDALVATGDTMLSALERLEQYNVGRVKIVSLLMARMAVEKINAEFPNVEIYCLGVEEQLDAKGYLVPGIGDAGDRLYGIEV